MHSKSAITFCFMAFTCMSQCMHSKSAITFCFTLTLCLSVNIVVVQELADENALQKVSFQFVHCWQFLPLNWVWCLSKEKKNRLFVPYKLFNIDCSLFTSSCPSYWIASDTHSLGNGQLMNQSSMLG